ncbi:MAG: hypothetical protein JNM78_01655 [Cyclobacteriaceae bacterium]|nr:hypothetical protein [Cyclobacteriaceae bacterium]
MRFNKKPLLIIGFIACSILSSEIKGQNIQRPLSKIGGYPIFSYGHVSGFFFSLESERVFKTNNYFTHGPRLDYDKDGKDPKKLFPGIENLVLGYQLKAYPFHFKNRKSYQGIFIGAYPCYFLPINKLYKNGPGLGSVIGYQYVLKDKISLSAETSMIYMQNVNETTPYSTNSKDRYFYITPSFKIGFKLGGNKIP